MQLHIIDTGYFKLDGGAMFGVVPRQIWENLNPPDDKNRCSWAMRCLLIDTGDRKVLIDTGMGNKQNAKFRSHFEPHGDATLLGSIAEKGYRPEDITDVFLTHFHFDHVGGALYLDENGETQATFPNARYWTNEGHYHWAMRPNAREKASFLKENFVWLHEQDRLHFVKADDGDYWINNIRVQYAYGHTEAMMLAHIEVDGRRLVYGADLFPSAHHIHLPYVMSYDIRPLDTLAEKELFLKRAVNEEWTLFFEHDPEFECGQIAQNDRGRYYVHNTLSLADWLKG